MVTQPKPWRWYVMPVAYLQVSVIHSLFLKVIWKEAWAVGHIWPINILLDVFFGLVNQRNICVCPHDGVPSRTSLLHALKWKAMGGNPQNSLRPVRYDASCGPPDPIAASTET